MWKNRGGLSCFLMDDPQDLFDPANVANFAATIPLMVHEGIQPLVVSNDFNFLEAVQSYVRGTNNQAIQLEVGEFSPISTSKCTATIAPILDEIRERNKAWKAAENDPVVSRELVYPSAFALSLSSGTCWLTIHRFCTIQRLICCLVEFPAPVRTASYPLMSGHSKPCWTCRCLSQAPNFVR